MTIHNLMRGIMTLLFIGGLSACQTTTTTTKKKEPPAPIDVSELISNYVAANPGATGIPLWDPPYRRITLNVDNTMTYENLRDKESETHAIKSLEGNRICSVIDTCLDLLRLSNGKIRVFFEFKSGRNGRFVARGVTADY